MSGQKILSVQIETLKLKFIDSWKFLNSSLKQLAVSYKIESTKGFFCFGFNDYESTRLPPLQYFIRRDATAAEIIEVTKWHDAYRRSGRPYVYKEQLHVYCENDVKILALVCQSFLKQTYELLLQCHYYYCPEKPVSELKFLHPFAGKCKE